jgi:hypothetical protein
LADHLPAEAAEAVLDLATGRTPSRGRPVQVDREVPAVADALRDGPIESLKERLVSRPADPFDHPDARGDSAW